MNPRDDRHLDEHLAANRRRWDERVPIHIRSAFYDTAGFRAGRDSLAPHEPAEVGEVDGLDLVHLQCHFGHDTISWARRGDDDLTFEHDCFHGPEPVRWEEPGTYADDDGTYHLPEDRPNLPLIYSLKAAKPG